MGPTELRSRDEWLAEVKRRGGRIKRRRQVTIAVVGVLSMVVPFSAVAGFLRADPDHEQELSVAGPAPSGQVALDPAIDGPSQPAPDQEPATTTTIAEVQQPESTRVASPASPVAIPPSDDPVVRSTTTTMAPANAVTLQTAPPTTLPAAPPASSDVAPCTPADVRVVVTTDKRSYIPGERVQGSATAENQSAATCTLLNFVPYEILNGGGRNVFQASQTYGYNSDPRFTGEEAKVAPGGTVTTTFYWQTSSCTEGAPSVNDSPCGPFPPGTYTVVAPWGGTGPGSTGITGRTTFQVS